MTTMDGATRARFELGRVVSQTFGVISRNAPGFLMLSAVLVGVPTLAVDLVRLSMDPSALSGAPNITPSGILVGLVGTVVQMVGGSLLQVALVQATVTDLNGGKVSPRAGLELATRLLLPIIGLAIIMFVGIMIGLFLLVVPGVILAVMWAVAVPAMVVEKRGVFESLQRSRDLTRGSRWAIFFLGLAYFIVFITLNMAIAAPSLAIVGLMGSMAGPGLVLLLTALSTLAAAIVSAAGVAVIYSDLRSAKEGVRPDQLAALFD